MWLILFWSLLLLPMTLGYKKGFAKMIISSCATLVMFVLLLYLVPSLTEVMVNNTTLDEFISSGIQEQIQEVEIEAFISNEEKDTLRDSVTDEMGWAPKVVVENILADYFEEASVGERLIEVKVYIANRVARALINAVMYIVVFVIGLILLKILCTSIMIVVRIPVIKGFDKIGGAITGLIIGVLICWIVFSCIELLGYNGVVENVRGQLGRSGIAARIYESNPVMKVFRK